MPLPYSPPPPSHTVTTMASTTEDTENTACANCNKAEEGDNKLKTCTACKVTKYCCRDCRIVHEKTCDRAIELFDEQLFKDHREGNECPICMITMPNDERQVSFKTCCGNMTCVGCDHAQFKENIMSGKPYDDCGSCAFCREPAPETKEEHTNRLKQCVERNNPFAMTMLGARYYEGKGGLPRDLTKARELFLKAGELGFGPAYNSLGYTYIAGNEKQKDVEKGRKYFEHAVVGGDVTARYILGFLEIHAGNYERAFRHFLFGARAGDRECLKELKVGFKHGHITKDEYTEALRAVQKYKEDTKSAMRDEALVYKAKPSLYKASPTRSIV